MKRMEQHQTWMILAAVGIGLLLGQLPMIEGYAGALIMPFLVLMLYGLFLSVPLKGFTEAWKNIRFTGTSLIINFLWTPFLAWGLGAVFLVDHPALWLGFILLLVTPCTDWYLVFTSTAKGNVTLAASMLPWNLLLQITFLPLYIFLFAGTTGAVEAGAVVEVILFLVIPLFFAVLTRRLLKTRKELLEQRMIPFFHSAKILFLCAAIAAMFASQGSYLVNNLSVILLLVLPLLFFFVLNVMLAHLTGKLLRFNWDDTVSLHMTTIARNSPVALTVVLTVFPEQPLIALVLIIGPLLELPILAVLSQLLLHMRKGKNGHEQ
ncbi:arsenic resistance protein [Alkalicoccus chagannorensis]|uniref:arsenic resistance protein n=1 Tax=Alkalicoccus chagannorensis TaxID=427072 RepID=UPI0003F7A0A7|nr:bile acid:sodium symporter [Alkalicoccus chagannorensis]